MRRGGVPGHDAPDGRPVAPGRGRPPTDATARRRARCVPGGASRPSTAAGRIDAATSARGARHAETDDVAHRGVEQRHRAGERAVRRGTPRPTAAVTSASKYGTPVATASLTRIGRRRGEDASPRARRARGRGRRSASGSRRTRGSSAAPMMPGARWWSGPMPLNRWVVSVAPASAAARPRPRTSSGVAERDHDAARGEHPDPGAVGIGLGRERHQPDQARVAVEQPGQPLEVHRPHQLAAGARRVRRRGTGPRGGRRRSAARPAPPRVRGRRDPVRARRRTGRAASSRWWRGTR